VSAGFRRHLVGSLKLLEMFSLYMIDIAEIRFVGKLDGHADIFVNQWIECYVNLRSLTPQMLYPQNDDRIVAIDSVMSLHPVYMGNESVLKIIINNTINFFFFKLQSAFCYLRTITVSECCLIKLLRIFYLKNIFISYALEPVRYPSLFVISRLVAHSSDLLTHNHRRSSG